MKFASKGSRKINGQFCRCSRLWKASSQIAFNLLHHGEEIVKASLRLNQVLPCRSCVETLMHCHSCLLWHLLASWLSGRQCRRQLACQVDGVFCPHLPVGLILVCWPRVVVDMAISQNIQACDQRTKLFCACCSWQLRLPFLKHTSSTAHTPHAVPSWSLRRRGLLPVQNALPATACCVCGAAPPWHARPVLWRGKGDRLSGWHTLVLCQPTIVTNQHSPLLPNCSVLTACRELSACSYVETSPAIAVHHSNLHILDTVSLLHSIPPVCMNTDSYVWLHNVGVLFCTDLVDTTSQHGIAPTFHMCCIS